MFDVKHALGAAFSETKTVNEKVHLVQMLLHYTQFPSGKDTNWRTVGRETELVTKLLDELGFPAEAYDKRVSILDNRVTDFRWTREGAAIVKGLRNHILGRHGLEVLSRILGRLYDTSATGLMALDSCIDDLPEGTDSASSAGVTTPLRPFIYRVEQKTEEKIKKYLDKFPTGEFSDFLRTSTSAIPSLGTMEKILVDLDLLHPEMRMFDVPHRPQNDHKTILRHFDDTASFPTANAFCNVITPFEYYKEQSLCEAAGMGRSDTTVDSRTTPLHGFFYRDKDTAAKMATPNTQILMATFEEFTPGNQGTCLTRSSDLTKFWKYVGSILSTFLEDNVKILPVSRIVIRNDHEVWSHHSSTRNGAYSGAMELEGFLTPGSVAGVSLCAIVNANSSGALCGTPVRHLRLALPTDDVSSVYETQWTPDRCLAAEWFSLTHDNLRTISGSAGNTYTGSILVDSTTVARKVAALKTYAISLKERVSRLLAMSAVPNNANYMYDTRRDRFSQLSALISSLCASLRTYRDPGADSEPLVFWDTTEHPDDPYAKLHDGGSMISAVYSGIPFTGSYFEKLADHIRTDSLADITEYVPKLIEHQLDVPEVIDDTFDKCGRMVVFETNVRATSDPSVRENLRRAVIRSVNTMLVARQIVPSAGIVDNADSTRPAGVYTPGEYPDRVCYVVSSGVTSDYARRMDLVENSDDLERFHKLIPEGDSLNANYVQPRNRETILEGSDYLFAKDKYERMYIVVILKGLRMRMALTQARAAAGLPLITATQRAGFSNGIIRLSGTSDNDLVSSFIRTIMNNDRATDYGGLSVDDRIYGYSPMAKSGYDGISRLPVQRSSYTGDRVGGIRVWSNGCVTGPIRL